MSDGDKVFCDGSAVTDDRRSIFGQIVLDFISVLSLCFYRVSVIKTGELQVELGN